MSNYLHEVFSADGLLAKAFPGYIPRPGQIALATAVDRAITSRSHLLAEAGCGIGKSIAYAVPATWHAAHSGKPIVIVTAGINLQEQLVQKDLPLLQSILPWHFTFALLKGRNNYLCLAGDTRTITRDGVRPIRDLAGSRHFLLDGEGHWVESEVRSFGIAKTYRIRLRRFNATLTVDATAEHRWFLKQHQDDTKHEVTTSMLKPGDMLACAFPRSIAKVLRPSPFGIAHGFTFGDGTILGDTGVVKLHGAKDRELLRFFQESHRYPVKLGESYTEREAILVVDLPKFFKAKPSLDEAPSYLYGWLAGYFAADGTVCERGYATLCSSEIENIRFVQTLCSRLGIATGIPRVYERDHAVICGRECNAKDLHSIAIEVKNLGDDFFVLSHHLARVQARRAHYQRDGAKTKPPRMRWKVESIQEHGEEEVFCAVVPTTHSFVLEGNLLSGNCVDRYYKHKAETFAKQTTRELPAEYRRQLPIVEDWARASIDAGVGRETGDVSELPFEPLHTIWNHFSVTSDECKGKRCKHARDCFPNAASELARQSMVIVTNYHMLYAHLAVYLDIGRDVVISPFEVAILDEAHRAADIARDVFGFKVTQETIRRFGRKTDEAERAALEGAASQFFFAMGALARNRDRYKSRLTGDFAFEERNAWQQLSERIDTVRRTLSTRTTVLQLELDALNAEGYGLSDQANELADRLGEAENLRDRANTAKERLAHAMAPNEHPDEVFFIEEDEKGRVSIGSKLITPSLVLGPGLFEKHAVDSNGQVGPRVAVIGTSATLATSEGFSFVASELGCGTYDTLLAPSPFDFPNQCLFISPAGMPDPNAPEFPAAVADAFATILELAGGRTLGLFTSHRMLQSTFDALVPLCMELDITLLRQGDAPRTKLIAQFKEDVTSVLLGTESFWAGVDVPGEALSVVVIDRLPFPTPADPVLDVLSSKDDRWFQHYSLPRAMIAFKQGFGRLIRSLECRGVVVCLDNRIATKRYGKDFLRGMPPGIPKSTRLEAISEWLYPEMPEPAIAPAVGAWDEP